MADFIPKKVTSSNYNNGNKYIDGAGVQPATINNLIESALYTQGLATNAPDTSEANNVDTPSVTVATASDGSAKLVFKNLKGEQGIQGERGISICYVSLEDTKITIDNTVTIYFWDKKSTLSIKETAVGSTVIGNQNNILYLGYVVSKNETENYASCRFTHTLNGTSVATIWTDDLPVGLEVPREEFYSQSVWDKISDVPFASTKINMGVFNTKGYTGIILEYKTLETGTSGLTVRYTSDLLGPRGYYITSIETSSVNSDTEEGRNFTRNYIAVHTNDPDETVKEFVVYAKQGEDGKDGVSVITISGNLLQDEPVIGETTTFDKSYWNKVSTFGWEDVTVDSIAITTSGYLGCVSGIRYTYSTGVDGNLYSTINEIDVTWLMSLVGPKGEKGDTGEKGDPGISTVINENDGTIDLIIS